MPVSQLLCRTPWVQITPTILLQGFAFELENPPAWAGPSAVVLFHRVHCSWEPGSGVCAGEGGVQGKENRAPVALPQGFALAGAGERGSSPSEKHPRDQISY